MPAIPHTEPALIQANGITLCYDTFGAPDAPPMLLISGHGCQMVLWEPEFCSELAARGYYVIRYDNRDVGLSSKFTGAGAETIALGGDETVKAPYTLHDMADDAIGLLDALHLPAAHLVGISMGGMIAQIAAIRHPERVRTLISIMSTTGDPSLPHSGPEVAAYRMSDHPKDRAEYIEQYARWEHFVSGPRYPRDMDWLRAQAARLYERGLSPDGNARQRAAISATPRWKAALRTLTVPTLVIHGSVDPLLPLEHGLDTARTIPGAKLLVIEGWGHGYPAPSLWPQLINAITAHAV